MGKRKAQSIEEITKRAQESGFDDDLEGIDGGHVLRPVTTYTAQIYESTYKMWLEFVDPPHLKTMARGRLSAHTLLAL